MKTTLRLLGKYLFTKSSVLIQHYCNSSTDDASVFKIEYFQSIKLKLVYKFMLISSILGFF